MRVTVDERVAEAAQKVIDEGLTEENRDELAAALDDYWGVRQ